MKKKTMSSLFKLSEEDVPVAKLARVAPDKSSKVCRNYFSVCYTRRQTLSLKLNALGMRYKHRFREFPKLLVQRGTRQFTGFSFVYPNNPSMHRA